MSNAPNPAWNPQASASRIDQMKLDELDRQAKAVREQKAIQDAIRRKGNLK
jgi:hypothetical protein